MNSLFQHFTQALSWSILHSLWQGILVYSLACIFFVSLPKAASKYKYALALFSQSAIFLAFITTFIYSLNQPLEQNNAITALETITTVSQTTLATAIFTYIQPLFPWFSSLYVTGLLVQLILFSNSYTKLHHLRRKGLTPVPAQWLEAFYRLKDTLAINTNIAFYLSNKISVPLTLGHLKPIILFPIALANNLDLKQTETILLHELAHIKRHDYLLNFIKVTMETVLFFNPFIWLLSRQIESEREHACDDIVITHTGTPIAYAQALMSVEMLRNEQAPLYAMAATDNKHHLLHRIKRITKMEKNYKQLKQHLLAIGLSSLALVAIAWAAPKPESTCTHQPAALSVQPSMPWRTASSSSIGIPLEASLAIAGIPNSTQQTSVKPVLVPIHRDTIIPPMPPEIPVQKQSAKEINEPFHSSERQQQMLEMQEQALSIQEHFNSDEWQQQLNELTTQSLAIADYFDSPDFKAKIADIERSAEKIGDYYESPEFKAKIAKIEQEAQKIEDYYESPEFKAKIAKIEQEAQKIENYYESPEFKAKINKIEENAKKLEMRFKDFEPQDKN